MQKVALVFATILILVGLAATQTQTQVPASAPEAIKVAAPVSDSYIIGPQDVLQISVWKEPDLSAASLPVRPDGMISLPLAGEVQATGLTATQLGVVLTEKFKKFALEPHVTVIVLAVNSKRVYLLGEVAHPGPIPMSADMTVLQALSTGGGLSQYANEKKIYILRNENGSQKRVLFNYKQAIKGNGPQQNMLLHPGDTIVVP